MYAFVSNQFFRGGAHWPLTPVEEQVNAIQLSKEVCTVSYSKSWLIDAYCRYFGYPKKKMIRKQSEFFIELDDGKNLTGKPDQFDGKNPWVSCNFSLKPIQWVNQCH